MAHGFSILAHRNMLPGYNHNIRYGEGVYHVQTEDSGVQNPHIITHLFIGGNIIESRKTSYAEIVEATDRERSVVELMQRQHKGMLKDLIGGQLDHKIQSRSKNAATLDGPAPLNVSRGQNTASFGVSVDGTTPKSRPQAPNARPIATGVPDAPPPPPVPSTTIAAPPPQNPFPPPAQTKPPQPPPMPVAPPADTGLFGAGAADQLFGVEAEPTQPVIEASTLARAFESKDESAVDSIFGEDLISEKSLDEVILSYLAEDMQKE